MSMLGKEVNQHYLARCEMSEAQFILIATCYIGLVARELADLQNELLCKLPGKLLVKVNSSEMCGKLMKILTCPLLWKLEMP